MDDAKDEQEIEAGMTAETHDLYRHDPYSGWLLKSPFDLGVDSTKTPLSSRFAVIVRRQMRFGDTEDRAPQLHSITVQSPLLKRQLGPVFHGYEGINTNLKNLTFKAPFHEFFYRWKEFCRAAPPREDKMGTQHYNLLFNIIAEEIRPHINQTEDLLKNAVICFEYVWALFQPGTEFYANVDGQELMYLVDCRGEYQTTRDGTRYYAVSGRYIDTDGEKFGFTTKSLRIQAFENAKPLAEMNILPCSALANIADIRARLSERGRKFEMLMGSHYKSYTGAYALHCPPRGVPARQQIDHGRVMIDCDSFAKHTGDFTVRQLKPLYGLISSGPLNIPAYMLDPDDSDCDMEESDGGTVTRVRRRRKQHVGYNMGGDVALSDEHYALCAPVVKGFCFKAKTWVNLDVDCVHEIAWDDKAFDQLVLPQDYKRIIWAFVDAQLSQSDDFDDVITGKGKGIIMLLSGDPGTGKTLTSESVAEAMKKPLYSMSAGELGNESDELERNLQRVLELSTKWGAVLLLDECDVFLEERSRHDLDRNKLVTVFLRLLEYYQGVMFLTTNRLSSFDPAFESRIHLTIKYPQLDFESRLHIWHTFVQISDAGGFTETDLHEFANMKLNGRQIKNVVKTARLLAASDKMALSRGHIDTVMRVKRGQFPQ